MKQCQSCGMPLNKDPLGGGTSKDGTKSEKYCSKCYQNGEFLNPDINTAEKMQKFVGDELKKRKMNFIIRKLGVWQIPRLERWKTK